jgi:DivIVA domain-containing protein
MGLLLILAVALVAGAVVFGVAVLVTGGDPGLDPAEPDGAAVPLPGHRPLLEADVARVRFDRALRGYRMAQVDQAMRRAAYDIGYKDELINVLEAEIEALRTGRSDDAEVLRRAREAALAPARTAEEPGAGEPEPERAPAGQVVDLGTVTPVAAEADPDAETGAGPGEDRVGDEPVLSADEPGEDRVGDEPVLPSAERPAPAEAGEPSANGEDPASPAVDDDALSGRR